MPVTHAKRSLGATRISILATIESVTPTVGRVLTRILGLHLQLPASKTRLGPLCFSSKGTFIHIRFSKSRSSDPIVPFGLLEPVELNLQSVGSSNQSRGPARVLVA